MLNRFVGASREIIVLAAVALVGCMSTPAEAQPFGGYMTLNGDNTAYIEIAHNVALNPTTAITLEGWVRFDSIQCASLIGKGWTQTYWVGPCNVLRSYTRGAGSNTDAGTFPIGVWTHWAVTSDGVTRKHYLNGVLVNSFAEAGPPTSNTANLRIGSDVSWMFAPHASLDEFRLWNVARTQAEIQSTMHRPISAPLPGLVAVWPLDTDGRDALGTYNGTVVGSPVFTSVPDDLAIDFGDPGLWLRHADASWALLHPSSPEEMAVGDLDNNGIRDLIVDFPGAGVWAWMNTDTWVQLHPANVSAIAVGDMDGNGQDEAIFVFPGAGVWVWNNNTAFYQLHPDTPNHVLTGDLDGNGKVEVILNFPGQGIWIFQNNATWAQLHTADGTVFAARDVDGGGKADLLINFPGAGIWAWRNNTAWQQIDTANATVLALGDLDGNGQGDAVIAFPGSGVWALMNGAVFQQLHTLDSSLIAVGNIDADGRDDVVISFPGSGVWAWMNNTSWVQLHTLDPQNMLIGPHRPGA